MTPAGAVAQRREGAQPPVAKRYGSRIQQSRQSMGLDRVAQSRQSAAAFAAEKHGFSKAMMGQHVPSLVARLAWLGAFYAPPRAKRQRGAR